MLSSFLKGYPFLLLFSSIAIPDAAVMGDEFDDAIAAKISDLGLRGAAIAYFDKNTMQAPITRGYGQVASEQSSSAVTPDTTFMIASISKPFVASAVAVLVDEGVISLDDDICNVVPEDFSQEMCRNPKYPDQVVTWRMLMTHRSSMDRDLPEVKNQSGDWISPGSGPSNSWYTDFEDTGNPTCPLEGVIDFYRALLSDDPSANTTVGAGVKVDGGEDLNWYDLAMDQGIWKNYKPGERSQYSNAAYGYLTALIELASGKSFPEFCREKLFYPLGMDTTAWFLEDLPAGTLKAVPLETESNGSFSDIGDFCYIDYGSGSLRTTANDLARWGDAMLTYGTSLWSSNMGNEVVNCQERDENNETVQTKCEFGYGWILLNNSMKGERRRRLDEEGHRRRLDERDDDDVTSTIVPSTENSSSSSSTNESTQAPSDTSSSSGSTWEQIAFENYDWTDGIMHDGSDAGVQTNMVILPKAGVYVAVLLNTNDEDGDAVFELTETVLDAPIPSYHLLDDLDSVSFFESVASSSSYWRSLSLSSSVLMSAASFSLIVSLFTE